MSLGLTAAVFAGVAGVGDEMGERVLFESLGEEEDGDEAVL